MALDLTTLGNGSGYVYVTEADGVTIVANLDNNASVWQNIQRFANTSVDLLDPTLVVNATFGYRFFGSTTGTPGSLVGTTELTRFIVNRGLQAPFPKQSATIAAGVVELSRRGLLGVATIDTEGMAASDDLNTISVSGVVDNDEITIIGASSARIVTLVTGAGNIFLSDNTNFSTANRQTQIVLRYFSAATAGWYEVSRKTAMPTVAAMRASSVPEPISGVNITTLTNGGGTINFEPGVSKGYQVLIGTVNPLLASWAIQIQPAPATPYQDGDTMIVDYRAAVTPTTPVTEVITIFGQTLTDEQALGVPVAGRIVARATYRLATMTWYYQILSQNGDGMSGENMAGKIWVAANFEPSLGNPASDGMVLSSTALGVRSWVANDAGTSVLYNTTSNNSTIANILKTTLKTYTLPGGTLAIDGDMLIIRATWQTAANANAKTMGIDFGGTTVATATFDSNNDMWVAEVVINRMGGATQSSTSKFFGWDSSTAAAVSSFGSYTLPVENLSNDVTINIFGTNGIAAASDITSRQASVEVYKKRN